MNDSSRYYKSLSLFKLSDKKIKYLFLLPSVFWIIAFSFFPLIWSLGISFFNYRLGRPLQFAGLDKFAKVFSDYKVANAAKVTLIYVLVGVVVEIVLGLFLALLFNQKMRGRQFFRTLFSMPLFATPVAVGFLAITIFYEEGGPVNSLLGLAGIKIAWLSHPDWALVAILILEVWQWTPFCFLVFLASLQSLPEEIYEAAALDYTSQWQIFKRLTLPLLQPVIIIVFLLRLIEAVKVFDFPFILTKGGPGTATEVYSMFVYRTGLKFFDLGYASALAYVLLIAMMIIVTFFFKRMREIYE
jgi:multiple sugar transport system permease protein